MSVFRVLNNRRKHHVHIVKINKDRIPKNVVNMKLKENAHKEDQDQDWKNRLGKMSHRWKKWRKSSFGKTKTNEQAWLLHDTHKVEMLKGNKEGRLVMMM